MDLPHQFGKRFYSYLYKQDKDIEHFKYVRDLKLLEKDFYQVEVGFSISFNLVIYIVVALYSIINPLVTLVGAIYFAFKYIVDKYTLCIVYPKNYDSKG
jgi:uncharacterized membrane protein YkgB